MIAQGPEPTLTVRVRALRTATPSLEEAPHPEDHRTRVAIVIPAFNEGIAIERLLRELPEDSTTVRYRTFVCDDGSRDATAAEAAAAGVTVLQHSRNLGIGAALTTAFEGALAWRPDIVVQIDADGQHDPALIPNLVEPILRGKADYVIGSRFLEGANGLNPVRRAGVQFYSHFVKLLAGIPITDVTSGFRAFRADAYDQISIRSENNWAVEMTLRAGLAHLRVVEIAAPFRPRVGGNSQFAIRRMFVVYHFRVVKQMFRAYTDSTALGPGNGSASAGTLGGLPTGFRTGEAASLPRLVR